MAERLATEYGIPNSQIFVLSNAAFLPVKENTYDVERVDAVVHGVRLGFLSNITEDKGIFDFFSVLRKLRAAGVIFSAQIAGPVDKQIDGRFRSELEGLSEATYLGPVYGIEKDMFYKNNEMLLFPTRYPNEAEPVTILEALSAGLTVIAADRGCISGMLPDQCGKAVPAADYLAIAVKSVSDYNVLSQAERSTRRAKVASQAAATVQNNRRLLHSLSAQIHGPGSASQFVSHIKQQ